MQQARDECARACEWVDDVDVFIAQGFAKFGFKRVIDAVDDKIHYWDGCVDNAEFFGHARKRTFKKLVVQISDDFLLGVGGFDIADLAFDAVVKVL